MFIEVPATVASSDEIEVKVPNHIFWSRIKY